MLRQAMSALFALLALFALFALFTLFAFPKIRIFVSTKPPEL
jgi:hypothetical protein